MLSLRYKELTAPYIEDYDFDGSNIFPMLIRSMQKGEMGGFLLIIIKKNVNEL